MFYRGVYHLVVDADACLSGALQNGTFRDETFEYLSAQKLHCWKLNVLAAQVNRHRVNALLKLMLRDDVIVDDGNDAVEFTGCRRGLFSGRRRGRNAVHDACCLDGSARQRKRCEREGVKECFIHSSHTDLPS